MWYADDGTGQRIDAGSGMNGYCPTCHERLIAKRGDIVAWHWAHSSLLDCDAWSEGETSWHYRWKSLALPQCREVVIGAHRADIRTLDGTVIELQHSTISPSEIFARETFYGRMVWIFDVRSCMENIDIWARSNYFSFRWRWPRKHIAYANKPVFLDLDDDLPLFNVRRMSPDVPCGGWGKWVERKSFCRLYLGESQVNH